MTYCRRKIDVVRFNESLSTDAQLALMKQIASLRASMVGYVRGRAYFVEQSGCWIDDSEWLAFPQVIPEGMSAVSAEAILHRLRTELRWVSDLPIELD